MKPNIKPKAILAFVTALVLVLTMRVDVVAALGAGGAEDEVRAAADAVESTGSKSDANGVGAADGETDVATAEDEIGANREASAPAEAPVPENAAGSEQPAADAPSADAQPAAGEPANDAQTADAQPAAGEPATGAQPADTTNGAPTESLAPAPDAATSPPASEPAASVLTVNPNLAPANTLAGNLALLETCAEDFLASNPVASPWAAAVNAERAASWLSFAYLRQLNPAYNTARWGAQAGTMGPESFQLVLPVSLGPIVAEGGAHAGQRYDQFTAYMTSSQALLHGWFTANTMLNGTDIPHMAAAASALRYNCLQQSGILGTGLGMVMNEQEYDDLSGWAGDLQTFAINLTDAFPNLTESEYAQQAEQRLGQAETTFNTADLQADADAANLCALIAAGQSLSEAAANYYDQDGVSKRYTRFAQNTGLFNDGRISAYTNQTNPRSSGGGAGNTWLIYSDASKTMSASQSAGIAAGIRAAFDALVDAEIPRYTVGFQANGGTPAPSEIAGVTEHSTIAEPTPPTKTGYVFGGWYTESACLNAWDFGSSTVTDNVVLYAKWTAAPNTAYLTNHYQQNLDGSYQLTESVPGTAATDSTVTAAPRAYHGFQQNTTHPSHLPQASVAADGSTALSLYYDRNSYALDFLDINGTRIIPTQNVVYGANAAQVPSAPAVYSLGFMGWRMAGVVGQILTSEQVKALPLLEDTEFHACYSRSHDASRYLRVSGLSASSKTAVLEALAGKQGLSLDGKGIWTADVALCDVLTGAETSGGGTISLPYPNEKVSQAYQEYDFYVLHLKGGVSPEFLTPTPALEGLVVTVDSFSPFAVVYSPKDQMPKSSTDKPLKDAGAAPSVSPTNNLPATNDPGRQIATAALLLLGAGIALFVVSTTVRRRRE
jgi:uncharacterized repeat protein (TIGR02543 family)